MAAYYKIKNYLINRLVVNNRYFINYDKPFLIGFILILIICCLFWNSKKKGFNYRFKTDGGRRIVLDIVFSLCLAMVVGTMYTAYPYSNLLLNIDSSVFLYIGKMMHKGLVPYRDLFDHKGPWLFLIQYLGFAISKNSYIGIWILEVLHMFVTIIFLIKVSRLFNKDIFVNYLSVIPAVLICGCRFYEGGNFTEEYALPCISIALYIFLKYLKTDVFKWYEVMISGLCMSIVLCLRVNMITLWLVFVPIILIKLIMKKDWKTLLRCVINFTIGIAIILIPIVGYYVYNGAYDDMIRYYITFNFSYCDSTNTSERILSAVYFFIKLMWVYMLTLLVTIIPNRKNKFYWINFAFFIVSIALATMSGNAFEHYLMVIIPAMVIPFTCLIEQFYGAMSRCVSKIKKQRKVSYIGFIIICVATTLWYTYSANTIIYKYHPKSSVRAATIDKMSDKDDNVLVLGNRVKYYLLSDRTTTNRYFYQTPPMKISSYIYEDFLKEFESDLPDLVFSEGTVDYNCSKRNNLGNIYRKMEHMRRLGIYTLEEYGDYFVYKKVK